MRRRKNLKTRNYLPRFRPQAISVTPKSFGSRVPLGSRGLDGRFDQSQAGGTSHTLNSPIPVKSEFSQSMRSARGLNIHFPRFYEDGGVRNKGECAPRLRKRIAHLSGLTAAISCLLTPLCYLQIQTSHSLSPSLITGLQACTCVLSLFQVVFIVFYWTLVRRYRECVRFAFRLSPVEVLGMREAPGAMAGCVGECLFHLLVIPPTLDYRFSTYSHETSSYLHLSDVFFLCVLLRNYHSLRLLYWGSDFSDWKTQHYAGLASVKAGTVFVVRCFLARFGLKMVLGAYGVLVLVSGLMLYVFEKSTPFYNFDDVRTAFWVVAYTQTTVGYGEITPRTELGRTTLVLTGIIGIFTLSIIICLTSTLMSLNLTECSLYSDLLYTKSKRKHTKQAVILLQKWWKFIHNRIHRTCSGVVVVNFYSQLRVYRTVLTKCQLVKDRRFERQVQAFDGTVGKQFRGIVEYLGPIRTADELVRGT